LSGFAATSPESHRLAREVGQMMIVGFVGAKSTSPGFRSLIDLLQRGVVGGALFLPRNIIGRSELSRMTSEIRECGAATSPIIAIDEEGGTVDWLSKDLGFERTPSALEVSRRGFNHARQQYGVLAEKLLQVGFNMNLAPVVDLNKNPQNPIIGVRGRSFSADPATVVRYARIFIAEHRARGVLTALKHFPGHGSSISDTHSVAADVTEYWSPDELVPYKALINAGKADAVMVGHLVNRRWGGLATLEGSTAISGLLRGELGYSGVVISDDLTMNAVQHARGRFSEVLISAIRAGIDIVLIAHPSGEDIEKLNSAVVQAVLAGQIERTAITNAWRRIASLKSPLMSSRR
jgi:beta-N-acetylhexosaminidase